MDKYCERSVQGQFEQGWDAYREEVLNVRKSLALSRECGNFPTATLTSRPDQLLEDEEKLYARFMEV